MALDLLSLVEKSINRINVYSPRNSANRFLAVSKVLLLGATVFILGTSLRRINATSVVPSSGSYEFFEGEYPVSLEIEKLNLSVPVVVGGIAEGEWLLSDTEVLFLPTSASLGAGHNTVIYGHNSWHLFSRLDSLVVGDTILVVGSEGSLFSYGVYDIKVVSSDAVNSLYSNVSDTLTLFTCEGMFDLKRLVIKAILLE